MPHSHPILSAYSSECQQSKHTVGEGVWVGAMVGVRVGVRVGVGVAIVVLVGLGVTVRVGVRVGVAVAGMQTVKVTVAVVCAPSLSVAITVMVCTPLSTGLPVSDHVPSARFSSLPAQPAWLPPKAQYAAPNSVWSCTVPCPPGPVMVKRTLAMPAPAEVPSSGSEAMAQPGKVEL